MNCASPSPASTRTEITRTVLRRFQHPQGLEFDKANGLFVAISSIRKDWSFTDCPSPSPTSARIGVRQSARIVRRHLQHPQGLEFLTDCPSLSPASARIGVRQSAWAVGRHLQHPQGLEVHGLPFAISSIRKDWCSAKRTGCSSPSPASARSGVTRPGLRYLQSRKEWSSAGRMNCASPSPASTRTEITRTVLRRFQHPQGLEFDKANGLFVAISSIRKDWSFTDCPSPSPTSARIGVRQSARIVRRHLQHPQGLEFLTDCPSLSPASARIGVRQSAWAVGRHLQHPQGLEVHGLPFAISSIRKDWSSVKRTDCSSPSPASARSGVSNRLSLAISSIRKDWCSANARAARPSPSPTSARSGGRQSERTVRRHLQHPQGVEFHGLSFAISSIRKDWCTAKRTGCSSPSYPLRLHY